MALRDSGNRPVTPLLRTPLRLQPGGGFAALGGGLEERLALRDQDGQTTGRGRAQGFAFLFEQGSAVRRVFDLLVAVVGAGMGSDFGRAWP
jgi:hypothetical protein